MTRLKNSPALQPVLYFHLFRPSGNEALVLTVSLCGKIVVTAVYQLTWIYTTELFPTQYRNLTLGLGQSVAYVSIIITPYINDILVGLSALNLSTVRRYTKLRRQTVREWVLKHANIHRFFFLCHP